MQFLHRPLGVHDPQLGQTSQCANVALTSSLDLETCLFEIVNGISSMAANTENTKYRTLQQKNTNIPHNLPPNRWCDAHYEKVVWINGRKWQNAQSSDPLGNWLRQSEMKAFFIRHCIWLSPPRRPPPALHPLSLLITLDYSWSCLVKETFDSKNKSPTRTRRKKRGKERDKTVAGYQFAWKWARALGSRRESANEKERERWIQKRTCQEYGGIISILPNKRASTEL